MDLSENITLTTGVYQGEKRIRMRNVNHAEKNISFSRPEWVFLMSLLEEINSFLLSLDKTKTADKTWDILRDAGGNKRVTAKKFESGAVIVDFRIFNFHISPELPTKFGIAITIKEWEQFFTQSHKIDDELGNHKQMRDSFKHVLKERILAKAKEHCHGCMTDHPSQKQHMVLGCLSPWEDQRDAFIEECFYTIPPDCVLEHYSNQSGDVDNPWKKLKTLTQDKTLFDECLEMD